MHRFKKIGVVLELTRPNEDALAYAKELVLSNQATVHLLCALQSELTAEQKQAVEKSLKDKVDFDFTLSYLIGQPAAEVTQYCIDHQLDMVLIEPDGSRNKMNRFFKGSLTLTLMRKTPCPVWVIKKPVSETYQRILIAVNPEEQEIEAALNDKLIQIGTSYAKRQSAECYLVTAWRLEGESSLEGPFINTPTKKLELLKVERKAECARAFEALQQRHRDIVGDCQTRILHGEPGYAIPQFVEENHIDLIVMGTVARSGLKGFVIGNTAENIVNQVDCSIMAIKPDNFTA